jgi:hypothetical protein
MKEVMDPICKGFDREKQTSACRVVHGAATLSVLLIINIKSYAIGLTELVKGGGMGEDVAIPEETDVLSTELDGTSACKSRQHGVFTWAKQKEKRRGA